MPRLHLEVTQINFAPLGSGGDPLHWQNQAEIAHFLHGGEEIKSSVRRYVGFSESPVRIGADIETAQPQPSFVVLGRAH